ncbi:MAG: glycosyltransferase family 9 protein [bacterium]
MENKFLICHRGALGDFVLTWPALHALRNFLPDFNFLGLGRPEYMRLAKKLGLVDSIYDVEASGFIDFFSGKALPKEMGVPIGAVLWLAQGRAVEDLLKMSASLPVILVPPFPSKRMHVALYHYLAIKSHFPIKESYPLSPHFQLDVKKEKYALIHPGSGSFSKNFHLQFYLEVAEILRQSDYADVRFILGPAEDEKIAKGLRREKIHRPRDAEALAEMLAGASLYIGNDSGVSHLSGVLGTSSIVLFKTTDPEVWGVLGRRVINIKSGNEGSALRKIQESIQLPLLFY